MIVLDPSLSKSSLSKFFVKCVELSYNYAARTPRGRFSWEMSSLLALVLRIYCVCGIGILLVVLLIRAAMRIGPEDK